MGSGIQLFASATPADNAASIDVPQDGRLVGVDWTMTVAASGADFSVLGEISFASTSQFSSNDARASITTCAVNSDLTTSGAAVGMANKYVMLPEIPVSTGERIYLHTSGTAIVVGTRAHLYFDFEEPTRRRTRMR